jgi:Uma2 family endonuclease
VWISRERARRCVDAAGHFRGAPELVVEVLSFGAENERRDREKKLRLYGRQGVAEYWIADWRAQTLEVYRQGPDGMRLAETLRDDAVITSSLLPGFSCRLSAIWPPRLEE